LEEDVTHALEYQSLRRVHDLNTWNMEYKNKKAIGARDNFRLRKVIFELMKIASVLIIGIFSTYLWMLMPKDIIPSLQTIYVPYGQRTELILSDGTEVWLNSGTTLTFPEHFADNSRDITLDGEGYFKVTKDKTKPFIVHTNKYNVRVLGTEFNVKSYTKNNYFETALLEGSVAILSDQSLPIILKENETVYLSDSILTKGHINDFNYFKWREGLICFEKENLLSLFRKLELYYDIQIVLNNEQLLKWSYTGKFRIRDGVEHVLRVLQLRHEFQYTKDNESNMIIID
jgi:ferric-dicitrate binding protein FerR (iron transport regulator)